MTELIVPDDAIQVMAQEFRVDARCHLFVDVPGARTRLRPGASDDRVEVTVAVSGCEPGAAQDVLDRLRLSTRQVKNTVRVQTDIRQQELDARWWAWVRQNDATIHLDLHLPASADADVSVPGGTIDASDIDGSLTLDVAGGSIRAEGLRGSLNVHASSSDVDIDWFEGSTLDVHVSAGSLSARRIDAEAVSVHAAASPVTLDGVEGPTDVTVHGAAATLRQIRGPLTARVQGGPLTLDGAPHGDSDLVAYGAPLQASLSDTLSANLRLEGTEVTLDDGFHFDGDRTPRLVAGRLNDGGPRLHLRAVHGAVRCQSSD